MSDSAITQSLNEQQSLAVTADQQHILVLAGAGSGKTRVLVHRVAYLCQEQKISPHAILAVTFTNKAAQEMRERVATLCSTSVHSLWMGTFHGLAHRLLRRHWQEAGLLETFQIMDADDQKRLIKRIQKDLSLEESQWPAKQTAGFINKQKQQGRRAKQVSEDDYYSQTLKKVYLRYEEICERSALVDFAELLLRSWLLLEKCPEVKSYYHRRFQYVMVDEFQDTNSIQYAWLRSFLGEETNLMVVGDDDQLIYSWRGAQIENIARFQQDYPKALVVRLEQNYRSTQTILNAANAVIANNENRLGKELWTEGSAGEPIKVYRALNESDEAQFICQQMRSSFQSGEPWQHMAVLYRSNAQSRVLEEALLRAKIPYRIYGGQKFFERAEIKDVLAYLRLLVNRHDDAAFERVINTPTRGIGQTTLNHLRLSARDSATSLWASIEQAINESQLSARALTALQRFLDLIQTMDYESQSMSLEEQSDYVLNHSGLLAHFSKDKSEQGLSRVENLQEFVGATKQFSLTDEQIQEGLTPLAGFLAQVVLETGENQAASHSDAVSLMTLHAAKGLEFPVVFLCGLEESLFPHMMSVDSPGGLEEERRLCYVGITRARQHLFITYAEFRRIFGREQATDPSRFLEELPKELLEHVNPARKRVQRVDGHSSQYRTPAKSARLSTPSELSSLGFSLGQQVRHQRFGVGTIVNYEGSGLSTRIQVCFQKSGDKWLVVQYARLQKL